MGRFAAWLLLAVLICPITSTSGDVDVERGHKVLVEELTATWCDYCAIIDPQVEELQQVHSSRLITLSLHPMTGPELDPLANAAMQLRAQRLNTSQADGTPAFWLDGGFHGQGVIDINELSAQVMRAESRSTASSNMAMWFEDDMGFVELNEDIDERNGTMLTIMLVERQVELQKGIASNGMTEFKNVLLNSISLDLDDESTIEGGTGWTLETKENTNSALRFGFTNSMNLDDDVFWLILHEDKESPSPLGVISTLELDNSAEPSDDLWLWIMAILGLLGTIVAIRHGKKDF